jgi:drug/metabolite transporter (DMT)-like permease
MDHIAMGGHLARGSVNLAISRVLGQQLPVRVVPAALVLGLVSYGLSIVFDVLALRYLGAAREAPLFATAPFIGAIAAMLILGDSPRRGDSTAAAMMIAGVVVMMFGRDRSPSGS